MDAVEDAFKKAKSAVADAVATETGEGRAVIRVPDELLISALTGLSPEQCRATGVRFNRQGDLEFAIEGTRVPNAKGGLVTADIESIDVIGGRASRFIGFRVIEGDVDGE